MTTQLTDREVTSQDSPIQFIPPSGSSTRGTDMVEMFDVLFSNWIRQKRPTEISYQNLLPILVVDLSSVYQHFEIKNEITFIKEDALSRIPTIIDKLIRGNDIFSKLDRNKLIKIIATLLETSSHEEFMSMTDNELTRRVEKVMAIETLAGMLDDLSSEQMKAFDVAVERRKLFK